MSSSSAITYTSVYSDSEPGEEASDEEDDDEEEEYLAPTDSSFVPVDDLALIDAVAATLPSSPPPSPLTPLLSPLPQISSPLLPVPSRPLPLPSPPTHTSPTYAEAPLGYRAARIRLLRAASPPTHHPSEIPSLPLLIPSTTHRDDLPEADMPLWKRAHFTTPTSRFEDGESSSAVSARQAGHTLAHTVDYGFIDTMDASIRAAEKRGDNFARWLLLTSVRPLLPDRHGFTLRVGSRPWRARLELCKGMVMYYRGRGLAMRTD
ncbi:hypothetical protein Tco_1414090 [Tanacetum coccineum]